MDNSHLNSSQIRAQSIMEDLKNHDLDHLQSFFDGLADPEPPNYRKINGKTEPKLEKVTLKQDAKTYQVGNVLFCEDNSIQYVYLKEENGEMEAFTSDPLPKDRNDQLSTSILDSILVDLIPLWNEKFKAIKRRLTQINDLRSYAHNTPNSPEPHLRHGKTLTKLMNGAGALEDDSISGVITRKRGNGDPVAKHPANKRKRIGFASIPDSVKAETIANIPDGFKTELFNVISQAAFPNFDNLIMAAWNVVCIYEHVGSEFPEFHKAVTELKSVLQEFDATYRKERIKAKKEEDTEGRNERWNVTNGTMKGSSSAVLPRHEPILQEQTEVLQGSRRSSVEGHSGDASAVSNLREVGKAIVETGTDVVVCPDDLQDELPGSPTLPSARSCMMTKPADYVGSANRSRAARNTQQRHTVLPRPSNEDTMDEEAKRRADLQARLKATREQINQFAAKPTDSWDIPTTAEDQRNTDVVSYQNQQRDRNRKTGDNGRGEVTMPRSMQGRPHPPPRHLLTAEVTQISDNDPAEQTRGNQSRKQNLWTFSGFQGFDGSQHPKGGEWK